ncbi:MAG: HRDC domain-containing protein, partial [Acidobacteria bacterium]|nr:HRDC domain-containing protein [Acidobacteriota bacterium]
DPRMLDAIFARLSTEPQPKEELQKRLRMDPDVFEKALEKLWIHGGALVDYAENVARGQDCWRDPYIAQGEQKQAQLELMLRYAQSGQCRMTALVRHFGDLADSRKRCGMCDFCAPQECEGQHFREPSEREREIIANIGAALKAGSKATGRLHTEISGDGLMSRHSFERLLEAMARAGVITLVDSTFEKDGRQIAFRKASLTREAEEGACDGVLIAEAVTVSAEPGKRKRKAKTKTKTQAKAETKKAKQPEAPRPDDPAEKTLKAWRLAEAKKRGVPAFRILTDAALKAIAAARPATARELISVPGVGLNTVEKYGPQIFKLLHEGR